MRTPPLVALVLFFAFATLSGCGGGGGGGTGETTISLSPSTDIVLFEDGSTNGAFPALYAGDLDTNVNIRSGLRFPIVPFIPTGATILSATLHMHQVSVSGTPYTGLGGVVVDRVDFGTVLDAADFAPMVLMANIGGLSGDATPGIRNIDVTTAVEQDIAANDLTSDFLVRFSGVNPNNVAEYAEFENSNNDGGTMDPPRLVIVYR
jgi:hypothetical protein